MANEFITLGGLKLEIYDEGVSGQWATEDVLRMTLNGKRYKSIGAVDLREEYEVNVKFVPDSGYAGYNDLYTWATDRTVAGQTKTLINEFGTNLGNYVIESISKPRKVSRETDGVNALYRARIKLAKSQ